MMSPRSPRRRRLQQGAALLTAMVIVTLVATLASAMVWQQWRAVQVESAERARAQALWILDGAIDWARLILREDARQNQRGSMIDHLGEPWAVPLAEARLSTFLAADRDNTDDAPEAFLSGAITDAQSRYNLRNVINPAGNRQAEEDVLRRLLDYAGARSEVAPGLLAALRDLAPPEAAASGATRAQINPDPPLLPRRLDQLAWLGLDAETVGRIAPYITLLPVRTPVNVNTAPKEVLAAVIPGLDLASAERLVQARQREPFRNLQQVQALLPQSTATTALSASSLNVVSIYFEIQGRLRLLDRVIEERALVVRRNLDILPVRRERVTALDAGAVTR